MRKITSLLMLFCAFVATAWAAPTDFPEMSTDGNIKWYTISNTRSASGKYLYWTANGVKDSNERTAASFFYFTGTAEECYIHNYSTELLFSGNGAWTVAGVPCKLSVSPLETGFMIGFNGTFLNENNYDNGFTTWGNVNDDGSIFVVEEITDFSAIINVPAAKTAAIAVIENYAVVSSIYPDATSFKEAINAVTPEDNSIAGLNAAVEAINAKVVDYKKAAYAALEGKYFSIQTLTTERTKGFMEMASSNVVGVATLASPAGLWQFVSNNDGTLKVFNPYTGKYLCEPQGASAEVAVTTDANSAGNYTLEVNNTNPAVADAKIKLTSNGKSVHMAGGHTLVRWDNGGASEWQVKEVTNFSELISAYKTATISTLDQWAALSVVFDASLITTAKANINNINTTDFATFAALDAELTNVTDAVAAKMFTFQTLATDAHRENVWVSANASTGKAIGAHTATPDYNAIWSLRHAGGVSFYIYNELTGKYMGKPSGNAALTDTPVDAYTFEIIDAANGVVEFKCGGETLHASNHNDDKLLSWDGDEDASRWYIRTIDITADIQAILDGLTSEDYAETPALGQYPTAAYEALVAAKTTAKTVEEVEAAIAAFKNSKNRPVFMITGVKDYVLGKSIYDDGVDAPNFKTTNVYDKTMWWALDMTETTVGVTEEVGIQNVGTGNGFWGVSSIKITETNENEGAGIADDGIFLFYTTGNNSPIHFQDANQVIVRYGSYEANSGSAMKFIYIGNTYDLAQLTDAHIEALSALQTSANTNAKYVGVEIGSGLGQYTGNKEAFNTAIANAQAIQSKTVVEVAAMNVADITAITTALTESAATFKLNMPTAGFYRVKSMNANDANKKGKYWQSKEDASGMELAAEKDDARSIIYLGEDNSVTSYGCGYALNQYEGMDAAGTEGKAWTITENAAVAGAYALHRNGDTYCLSDWTGSATYGQNDANAAWAIEEVTVLPVKVSAAGYATLYAPVALTLPAELKAYTVTVNGESAMLNEIEGGVIPANTGVVLEAAEGTYNLTVAESDVTISGNDLLGTVAASYITADAYALGLVDGEVGFYTATKNQQEGASWLNNGFKAYLPKTGLAATLRFNFGGNTTAIESVLIGTDANAPIYDLSGRRVNNAVKGGIYIVNGKKVYIK